jgi:hypothetical protein
MVSVASRPALGALDRQIDEQAVMGDIRDVAPVWPITLVMVT